MDTTNYILSKDENKMSKAKVLGNFVLMSVLFSINHGCVTACIALASSDLGADLAPWSSGTLYLMYTLCALVGANAIVHFTGAKYGLASALFLYCAYIASFLVARKTDGTTKWVGAILGSVIGGFAAGYLWTAQGPFMQGASKLYAPYIKKEGEEELLPSSGGQDDRSDEIAKKKSNSLLAAIFGFTYLVCEALMKVASTYIPTKFSGGENTIYVVFTILSVLCAFGMLFIVDLSEIAGTTKKRDENTSLREMLTVKTTEAIRLLFTDPKMILLYPVQMAFGIAGSFVAYVHVLHSCSRRIVVDTHT